MRQSAVTVAIPRMVRVVCLPMANTSISTRMSAANSADIHRMVSAVIHRAANIVTVMAAGNASGVGTKQRVAIADTRHMESMNCDVSLL